MNTRARTHSAAPRVTRGRTESSRLSSDGETRDGRVSVFYRVFRFVESEKVTDEILDVVPAVETHAVPRHSKGHRSEQEWDDQQQH